MKKADIGQVFTKNLRAQMERAGMDGKTLAGKAKVSESHLSEVKRGLSTPTIALLNDLAHALGLEAWELLVDWDASRNRVIERLFPPPKG